MDIFVCVGSSCHLKHSYHLIERIQSLVEMHHIEEHVSLKASFCLGTCTCGLTLKIDGTIFSNIQEDDFDQTIQKLIITPILNMI